MITVLFGLVNDHNHDSARMLLSKSLIVILPDCCSIMNRNYDDSIFCIHNFSRENISTNNDGHIINIAHLIPSP